MSFTGNKRQLRLMSGLLAIFVTLYFMADWFGGISAESNLATLGGSGESGELVDSIEDDNSAEDDDAAEEDNAEEDEIMPLAEGTDDYFRVSDVNFTLNGNPVAPGQTVYVKSGDDVAFDFKWFIQNSEDESGWSGSEEFVYPSFGDYLGDIRIDSFYLSGPLTVGKDASASYEIETDPVTGKIGALKITISSKTGTFNHDGAISLAGKVEFSGSGTDGHTLGLDTWSCTIKNSEAFPNLNISKWADGQIYYEDGAYYQNFTVKVNNSSEKVDATNVLLTDQYSENFANRSLEFRGAKLNGTPVSNPTPDHDQNKTTISVGTIPAKGEYELSYRLKVDKPQSSLSVYSNFENTMSASCKELDRSVESRAWGSYTPPSFNKSGTYDNNNGEITWTLKVNPGVFKDDPNLSFTVTDIPVENLTVAEITTALGKTTLTKADFVGPDADGNYICTFTTTAPDQTAFEQKVTNKAELKIYDGKHQSSSSVTVPANDGAPKIDKKIGAVSPVTDGTIDIPWSFDVYIPEDIVDPNNGAVKEEVVNIQVEDRSSTPNNDGYGGKTDRIKILYDTFKLTAPDGTEYKLVDPPQGDGDVYLSGRNCELESDAGAKSPFTVGLWYNQNLGFSIGTNSGADLSAFKGKTFTVSYDMRVVSTDSDIISKIDNEANLTVTTRKKNNKEETTQRSDTESYQKLFSVSKGEHYWPAGIDGAGGNTLDGKSGVKGWTVKVTNNTIDTNTDIVLTDTLPEGYKWVDGAIQAEIVGEYDAFIAKLSASSITAGVDTPYNFDVDSDGAGNETIKVTIRMTDEEFAKFTAGTSLKISYCGYMHGNYMDLKTNNGNVSQQFTLRNEAEVTLNGEKGIAAHTMLVTLPMNPALVKDITSQKRVGKGLEAAYVLKINENKDSKNEGNDITVTDELGTKLKLVPNSIVVWEYAANGSRSNVTNTVKPTISEAKKDGEHTTLTFKLKDKTYYQIEYKVTGSELLDLELLDPDKAETYLDDMSDEEINKLGEGQGRAKAIENLKKAIENELNDRYGNTATISGQTEYSNGIMLDSKTFRFNTSYNFKFRITGKKIWPQNDTPPDEIVLKLTTTETYVPALAEELGKKTNQTVTYYHLLFNGTPKEDEAIDGNRHTYQNVTVEVTDNSWSFVSDYLTIEDLKGSKFVYTLEEEEVDGYFPTYLFDPDEGTGMTTTDGSKFLINGPINVEVENKRINTTGTVKLLKTDASGDPLTGAEFELTTIRDLIKDVEVTPSDAIITKANTRLTLKITKGTGLELSELPAGTYTLTETKAPTGYKLYNTPYKFRVRTNGAIEAVSAGDYSFTGTGIPTIKLKDASTEVSINKVDMTSKKQLPNAVLTIKNDDGDNIEQADVENADSVTKNGSTITFTTTKDTAKIKRLPAGAYTLTETVAPNGYAVTTEFKFTIGVDGSVTKTSSAASDTLLNGTITLNDKLTEFTVEKTDEDDLTLLLGGAVFTVRATSAGADLTTATAIAVADADYDPAQNTKNSITFTTQEGKAATIKGLPAGEYTLEEATPPEGYQKSASAQTFTINTDGTMDHANNKIVVENKIITADLTVKKVGEDDPDLQLTGAEFTITSKKSVDWTRVQFDGAAGTGKGTSYSFTTDGDDFKIEGLPVGEYALSEAMAPTDYLPLDGEWKFKVNDDGSINSTGTVPTGVEYVGDTSTVTVTDEKPEPGTIVIYKNDENGVRLAGAKIKLTVTSNGVELPDGVAADARGVADAELSTDKKSLTFTTTADAARILGLPAGTYEVEELEAPSGYIKSTAKPIVVLTENEGKVSFGSAKITNRATEISINKVDMTSKKQLPDAVLTIRNDDGDNIEQADVENADSVTKNGSTITFTTTKDTAKIKRLPAGDYTLTETVAPNGYVVTSEFKFTIGEDGSVTKTSGADSDTLSNGTITLNDELTEIFIKKVDMTNAKQLPDATLLIREVNGKVFTNVKVTGAASSDIDKDNSRVTLVTGNTDATIQGLPEGDYELTETIAPTGYDRTTTKFTFTIDKEGNVKATSTNTTSPAGKADIMLNGKTITVENAPLAAIKIVKKYIDESNAEIPATTALRGATSFGLFSDAKCSNQIGAAVSPDANGEVIFRDLSDGTYYVKEIWSPEGFVKDETVYECVVSQGTVTYSKDGTAVPTPAYTNVSTTEKTTEKTTSNSKPTESQTSDPQTSGGSQTSDPQTSGGSQPSGSQPSGSQPTGSRPSGGTKPTGTTTPTTVTTAPTTATTSVRSTLTEPDEIEPEKSTAKTKKTKKTTAAPETDLPKTTTVGTERTDIAIGVNQVTREPGIGIDSNLTMDEENPNTAVPFTSLAAVFAATGTLAVVTRKKKKK